MGVNKKIIAFFVLGVILGSGLYQSYFSLIQPALTPKLTLQDTYMNAVHDSMVVKESKLYSDLTSVVESNDDLVWEGEAGNKSVLVVIFTRFASSYPVGETVNATWGDTWVTVAPEIQTYFSNNVDSSANLTLRTLQLLGLPPTSGNTYFVELWVNPESLFRPTPDNEIDDTVAQLSFPDSATEEYKRWFNDNIVYSYFPEKFPWTRLGYTYNWGRTDSHVGLSEFVLKQYSMGVVKSVSSVDEYLGGT